MKHTYYSFYTHFLRFQAAIYSEIIKRIQKYIWNVYKIYEKIWNVCKIMHIKIRKHKNIYIVIRKKIKSINKISTEI